MINNFLITGCTHYGHYNIIKYCNRPFKTLEEMDNALIENANSRVTDDILIYHLGDFCFRNSKGGKVGEGALNKSNYYINKLKGKYIFVQGNHDNNNGLKTKNKRIVLYIAKMYINLIHNPTETIISDEHYYYPLTLCSHVHCAWKTKEIINQKGEVALCINCGVDVNDFKPISFDEVMAIYHRWLNSHSKKSKIEKLIHKSNSEKRK